MRYFKLRYFQFLAKNFLFLKKILKNSQPAIALEIRKNYKKLLYDAKRIVFHN